MSACVRLSGEDAERYLSLLRGLLGVARAGAQYWDAARLAGSVRFLGPTGSAGRHPFVEVDARSGLPTRRQLARLALLHVVAREFFAAHRVRQSQKPSVWYQALAGAAVAVVPAVEARLMGRSAEGVRFLLVSDGVDPDSGCYVRHSLRVLQRPGGRHLALDRGEQAKPSELLREALRQCAGMTAKSALTTVGALSGLEVQDAVRGQLGPLQLPDAWCRVALPALSGVLRPGAGILHLCLERAGEGVAQDGSADPWSPLIPEPGPHRVVKERRLVCSPELEAPLRALLSAEGARVVVRSR